MAAQLIINADDFGYDPAVTRGIVVAMTEGVVSSTTMMVNSPSAEEAARAARQLPLQRIGLHLNLARWAAVSQPSRSFSETTVESLTPDFVEAEALAQLDRLEALLGHPASHIDVHKHLHRQAPVLIGLAAAARARHLPVRSVDEATRRLLRAAGVSTNDAFVGDASSDPYWTLARLEASVASLPSTGVIEWMCHPGYCPVSVSSGYGLQREVELATFCSPTARLLLTHRGIQAVGWGDAR